MRGAQKMRSGNSIVSFNKWNARIKIHYPGWNQGLVFKQVAHILASYLLTVLENEPPCFVDEGLVCFVICSNLCCAGKHIRWFPHLWNIGLLDETAGAETSPEEFNTR